MEDNTNNIVLAIVVITLVSWSAFVASTAAAVDCTTITALISACSSFVRYGLPDPIPGSPCCIAMTSLNNMGDTSDNRRGVCRCMMDLITTYNPNATAIATLPGFCGVSLGFTIDPNTDCE
ncbi:putative non-specific lipid-transfer protein 14 [Forsythia ovata]|uniref:Non-specific lipid-transfer protein 14 n=1 Tax=Forsythia ovata TaxID=205694 RepID=A0ABD1X246_9LAMI